MSVTLPRGRTAPTGVEELTANRTVSPMPAQLRVSVFGPRTQLDITLPAEARAADVVPYLTRLIAGREASGVDAATVADERTSRHLLRRGAEDGEALPATSTLREAGVQQGDMLFLCGERTLLPPTLYDDVVDAAAQLNRAAHSAWDRVSAGVMAGVALYACVGVLVWMSLDARFDRDRPVVIGFCVAASAALLAVATVANRMYAARHIAAVCAWATVLLNAAALLAVFAPLHDWGPVAACATLILVNFAGYRLVGAGRWAFLAVSVVAGAVGLALAARVGLGVSNQTLGVVVSLTALLLCWAVPRLTTGWDRFAPRAESASRVRPDDFEDPFRTTHDDDPAAQALDGTVPTADEVAVRARSAAEVRSALYTGAGSALVFGAGLVLTPLAQPRWTEFTLVVVCAAVLALRVRLCGSSIEQAGVLATAGATLLLAGVSATMGPSPAVWAGLSGLALAVTVGAVIGVLTVAPAPAEVRRRRGTVLAYLDYLTVAALIPVAVAVVDGYARLRGLWA